MEQIEAMGFMAIMLFFLLFYAFLTEPFGRLLYWSFNLLTGSGQI